VENAPADGPRRDHPEAAHATSMLEGSRPGCLRFAARDQEAMQDAGGPINRGESGMFRAVHFGR
jgi:hypothetical protein